jgi:hypothetical protein
MKTLPFLAAIWLLATVGCSREASKAPSAAKGPQPPRELAEFQAEIPPDLAEADVPDAKLEQRTKGMMGADPVAQQPAGAAKGGQRGPAPNQPPAAQGAAAPPAAAALPRKIIHTADLVLVVANLDQAEHRLKELIQGQKEAYIAHAEVANTAGTPRQGRWKIRIPVAGFDAFIDALLGLGVPERKDINSSDVTEQFYDIEARIKVKKAEEAQLLKLLDKSAGKLEDVLAIRRDLKVVREEIEQLEGRLRLLANLTSLTTVTLTLKEIKDYVPPQAPTFSASIQNTFSGSVDALGSFGRCVVLFLVAMAPWLPIVAVVAGPLWLLGRRSARGARSARLSDRLERESP